MQAQEILKLARDAGIKLVMFAYCDNSGIIRGKATHISGLERRLESGIGVTTAMQAMGDMDRLQVMDGMGPVGEFRMVPDLDTFTVLPYAPGRALALVDMITMDREPWDACPRHFLKRMLAKAHAMGITFQAAFEPEWYLARREGDSFVPMDQSLDNSTLGASIAREVVDDVVDALEAQGLRLEQYHTEVGHGQQELSITHADALRAADNHIIYRETVRNVAWQPRLARVLRSQALPGPGRQREPYPPQRVGHRRRAQPVLRPRRPDATQPTGIPIHRRHHGTPAGFDRADLPQHEQLPPHLPRVVEHRLHLLRARQP